MTNLPASSEEIDKFVPPDILQGSTPYEDFGCMFYNYRDVMDYNSRLFVIFAKSNVPITRSEQVMKRLYKQGEVSMNLKLATVLLSTKSKELIHLERGFLNGELYTFFTSQFKDVYDKQVKDGVIIENDRNFRIMSICVGNVLYNIDKNIERFIRDCSNPSYRKQKYFFGFARKEERISEIEYARQSFAYYNIELPELMKFIYANLEMIVEDVGEPILKYLLAEDRKKVKYQFITRKEQSLRLKLKRKEALETKLRSLNDELQRLDAEIKKHEA